MLLGLDRKEHFNTAIEIPVHDVGAAQINFLIPAVFEQIHARMLQETSDDTGNADVLTESRDARPQTTYAANDQCDRHAGLRRRIELLNQSRVRNTIAFGDDS